MNQTFEEWLIKYIATQKNSNYENYKKYLREEAKKNGTTN